MAHGQTSRARAGWRIALLASFPALSVGPLSGADALLLHAHGVVGKHVHLVGEAVDRLAEHHESHGTELAVDHHDHEHEHHPASSPSAPPTDPGDESSRILISFPGQMHLCPVGSAPFSDPALTFELRFEAEPRIQRRVNVPAFAGTGPPNEARSVKERSGHAAVLAMSRAILI